MKIKNNQKTKTRRTESRKPSVAHQKQPFIEHAYELRRRIYYIVASVLVSGGALYGVQQHIVRLLLKPAHGQSFIYTSPGGGIDFLFKVCLYGGLIISTPVIVYNLLGFISPLINESSRRFIISISIVSSLLAVAGVVFGYSVGLPAALHFLLHQFKTVQIKPLVTIQAYLNFVMAYILGSALLFQLPIILISINRIKPLKPSSLFHYERWVILAAFILSGLMNPTPNIVSQLMVAGPFIIMYQIGIGIIALVNRSRYSPKISQLIENDALIQLQRLEKAGKALPVEIQNLKPKATSLPTNPMARMVAQSDSTRRPENKPAVNTSPVSTRRSFINTTPDTNPLYRSRLANPLSQSRSVRRSYMDFVPNISNS
jgi:sec-independent protein translocase protein TatC